MWALITNLGFYYESWLRSWIYASIKNLDFPTNLGFHHYNLDFHRNPGLMYTRFF